MVSPADGALVLSLGRGSVCSLMLWDRRQGRSDVGEETRERSLQWIGCAGGTVGVGDQGDRNV